MRPVALRLIVALVLASALAPAVPALSRAETAGQITVTGSGLVDQAPDMASFSIGVMTRGDTAAVAMDENSAEMARVIARITGAGVEARDVQTSGLSLNPDWASSSSGQPRLNGYVAMNMVSVRVRALDDLGGILDASVSDGANSLNGVSFGLSDPEPALNEARQRAVADARAKAELLARAAGVELGRIVQINENGGYGRPQPMFRAEAAFADAVPVAPGEVTTDANVTIVWEIKQ